MLWDVSPFAIVALFRSARRLRNQQDGSTRPPHPRRPQIGEQHEPQHPRIGQDEHPGVATGSVAQRPFPLRHIQEQRIEDADPVADVQPIRYGQEGG